MLKVGYNKETRRRNYLKTLPVEVGKLKNLHTLDLSDNKLPIPAEILNQANPQLIFEAYFGVKKPLHEAKLLIVGQDDVGKTVLFLPVYIAKSTLSKNNQKEVSQNLGHF